MPHSHNIGIRHSLAPLVAQTVKHLSKMQETRVQTLGREDLLEKEMVTHSSTLAWKIPWIEEPGGLQSMGSQSQTQLSNLYFLLNIIQWLPITLSLRPKLFFKAYEDSHTTWTTHYLLRAPVTSSSNFFQLRDLELGKGQSLSFPGEGISPGHSHLHLSPLLPPSPGQFPSESSHRTLCFGLVVLIARIIQK